MQTHGCSLSDLPLFVAEASGLFEAEGLDVEGPRIAARSSTSGIIASGIADLGTVTEPLIDALHDAEAMMAAGPDGMIEHAVRHHPDYDRIGLEAGARRQPPSIEFRHPEPTNHHDRRDSLQSLGLVLRDDRLPHNAVSFDPLAVELERTGRTGPSPC